MPFSENLMVDVQLGYLSFSRHRVASKISASPWLLQIERTKNQAQNFLALQQAEKSPPLGDDKVPSDS